LPAEDFIVLKKEDFGHFLADILATQIEKQAGKII
jgi:hypothetical protein